MTSFIQKFKAKRRIPSEVYKLIERINFRYSHLNLDNGEFNELIEREKLSKLISIIDKDTEISKLNSLAIIGSIAESSVGEKTKFGGFGKNLCIGNKGLYIYDWNDYQDEFNKIPATPESLEKHIPQVANVESLRGTIVNYTNRETYIERVADFKKFN